VASFLKRQRFLSRLVNRPKDVGKPKAEVAAARIMERVAGVSVTPHFCRIEDKPVDWYRDFHVIALGLDSLEVRIVPRARLVERLPDAVQPCPYRRVATSTASSAASWVRTARCSHDPVNMAH
jgi:hypothetical protein